MGKKVKEDKKPPPDDVVSIQLLGKGQKRNGL